LPSGRLTALCENNAAENGEPQPQNKRGRLTVLCETKRLKTGNHNPRAKEAAWPRCA